MSRKAESLTVSDDDLWKLRRLIDSKLNPARLKLRARVILGATEGLSNHELADRFSVSRPTVIKWRRDYVKHGLGGLLIPRAPSDRSAADLRKELEIVNLSFGSYPQYGGLRWTIHRLARHLHVSRATVQRTWKKYGITGRKLWGKGYPDPVIISPDPSFGLRITAVVGLYYHAIDRALAFAVDPRPAISASFTDGDCGGPAAAEIDSLLAALKSLPAVTTIGDSQPASLNLDSFIEDVNYLLRLRAAAQSLPAVGGQPASFLTYLNRLDGKVPGELEVHLVMQWYGCGVHTEAAVQQWLSGHPRFLLHFIPRIRWIEYVECWLELIQASGRQTPLLGAKEMVTLVDEFVRKAEGVVVMEVLCIAVN